MPRTGRPREYQARERFVLYLEATELRSLQDVATAAGAATTAAWARAVLLEVASRETASAASKRPISTAGARPRRRVRAAGDARGA